MTIDQEELAEAIRGNDFLATKGACAQGIEQFIAEHLPEATANIEECYLVWVQPGDGWDGGSLDPEDALSYNDEVEVTSMHISVSPTWKAARNLLSNKRVQAANRVEDRKSAWEHYVKMCYTVAFNRADFLNNMSDQRMKILHQSMMRREEASIELVPLMTLDQCKAAQREEEQKNYRDYKAEWVFGSLDECNIREWPQQKEEENK